MVTPEEFRSLALSLPGANEEAHFEKISFRYNKKIFATYDAQTNRACIKLSETDQHVFSSAKGKMIYPVDNKWGKQGWTFIELEKVHPDLFRDALTTAYEQLSAKKGKK